MLRKLQYWAEKTLLKKDVSMPNEGLGEKWAYVKSLPANLSNPV